jgi:hypothetical protein
MEEEKQGHAELRVDSNLEGDKSVMNPDRGEDRRSARLSYEQALEIAKSMLNPVTAGLARPDDRGAN